MTVIERYGKDALAAQFAFVGNYGWYFCKHATRDETARHAYVVIDEPSKNRGDARRARIVIYSEARSTLDSEHMSIGNVNYRFPLSGALWMEPTAGFQYIASVYSSGAEALGLAPAALVRELEKTLSTTGKAPGNGKS